MTNILMIVAIIAGVCAQGTPEKDAGFRGATGSGESTGSAKKEEPQTPPTLPSPPATPVDPIVAKREAERWERLTPAQQVAEKAVARAKALAEIAERERGIANTSKDEAQSKAAAKEQAAKDAESRAIAAKAAKVAAKEQAAKDAKSRANADKAAKVAAKEQAAKDAESRAIAAEEAKVAAAIAWAARSPAEIALDSANNRLALAKKRVASMVAAHHKAIATHANASRALGANHEPRSVCDAKSDCGTCASRRRQELATRQAVGGAAMASTRAVENERKMETAVREAKSRVVAEQAEMSTARAAEAEADRWSKLTPSQQATETAAKAAAQTRADAERRAKLTPEERARLAEAEAKAAKKVADEAVRASRTNR